MSAIRLLPLVLALATPAVAQDPVPAPLNPLAGLDKATLHGFVDMPLFEPSRRPPTPPPPVAAYVPPPPAPLPAVVEPPPMLRLLGVVEGAHSLAAIVRRVDSGKTETLRSGDRLGSWIVAVLPAGLRVRDGDRVFDYVMFKGAGGGPQAVDTTQFPSPALAAARELLTGPTR